MSGRSPPYFTVGHSNHPASRLATLLAALEVAVVADVRSVPRSRANPQFNADALREVLAGSGIAYEHLAALGGLRPRQRDVDPQTNAFWENRSFHNYADYAMGAGFREGFDRLLELGASRRCAVMCAEALWWRCHRRIVADYLMAAGKEVVHVLSAGRLQPARITPVARRERGAKLIYPKPATT